MAIGRGKSDHGRQTGPALEATYRFLLGGLPQVWRRDIMLIPIPALLEREASAVPKAGQHFSGSRAARLAVWIQSAVAEQAYVEARDIRRKLAEANPAAYLPDLAMSLNNLTIFLTETGRPGEAEQISLELQQVRRHLAR